MVKSYRIIFIQPLKNIRGIIWKDIVIKIILGVIEYLVEISPTFKTSILERYYQEIFILLQQQNGVRYLLLKMLRYVHYNFWFRIFCANNEMYRVFSFMGKYALFYFK